MITATNSQKTIVPYHPSTKFSSILITWYFWVLFSNIFFGKFWFLIKRMQSDFLTHINLYIYILFWASFEKFESRTMWVDRDFSFRKTWSNFIKKWYTWLDVVFSNIFSKFWPRGHIVWLISSFQGSYILSFHRSYIALSRIYKYPPKSHIFFGVQKFILKKLLWLDSYCPFKEHIYISTWSSYT